MTELIFQKGLMWIEQIYQKDVIFVTIGILKILVLNMKKYLSNGWHDLIQKAMSFNNVALVYVKWHAYRISFWYMSKDDAINIMNGSDIVDKRGVL